MNNPPFIVNGMGGAAGGVSIVLPLGPCNYSCDRDIVTLLYVNENI
jgi:hypothetical protein